MTFIYRRAILLAYAQARLNTSTTKKKDNCKKSFHRKDTDKKL
jgi:hypothetical protein